MRHMLNTLYITSKDAYASLNGETVEVKFSDNQKKNIPLLTLENIVCFSYKGVSPALIGKCEQLSIPITFFSPYGKYLGMTGSGTCGNVLLRREQYSISPGSADALEYSRNFIIGKLYNSIQVILRIKRDHFLQVDSEKLEDAVDRLKESILEITHTSSQESLRGIEGNAAAIYFDCFNELILQRKDTFKFESRNRRPPTDPVNALLSFAYSLLASECSSALLSVGLDPFAGFFHTDRPGRRSLALDIMEEFRPVIADRFVLSVINNRVVDKNDFVKQDSGAVLLTDSARKTFLSKWQSHKREEFVHPLLKEKISWGLAPYSQAQLLARTLRGDLEQYPPLLWR